MEVLGSGTAVLYSCSYRGMIYPPAAHMDELPFPQEIALPLHSPHERGLDHQTQMASIAQMVLLADPVSTSGPGGA